MLSRVTTGAGGPILNGVGSAMSVALGNVATDDVGPIRTHSSFQPRMSRCFGGAEACIQAAS